MKVVLVQVLHLLRIQQKAPNPAAVLLVSKTRVSSTVAGCCLNVGEWEAKKSLGTDVFAAFA